MEISQFVQVQHCYGKNGRQPLIKPWEEPVWRAYPSFPEDHILQGHRYFRAAIGCGCCPDSSTRTLRAQALSSRQNLKSLSCGIQSGASHRSAIHTRTYCSEACCKRDSLQLQRSPEHVYACSTL